MADVGGMYTPVVHVQNPSLLWGENKQCGAIINSIYLVKIGNPASHARCFEDQI